MAVLAGAAGARLVDVEVLLVDREDRQAERDPLVVTDRDARQRRLARADHVQPGRHEMREVAQRRHALGAVRVVGEDRPPARGAPPGDRPVVRALAGTARGAGRRGELDGRDRELVHVEHVVGDRVEVEPGRDLQLPRRLQAHAQRLGLGAEVAQDERSRDLVGEVGDQPVAADAHDVLGRPALRRVVHRLELDRERDRAALDQIDVRVHAGGERRRDRLRVVAVGGVLAGEVAAIEEHPRRAVLLEIGAPERGRQAPEAAPAPEVDLPQPVACRVEALEQERVRLAGAVDVRDPPAVHEDLARRRQPRQLIARPRRGAPPP